MKLLASMAKEWPERYYVGIDIGYREHVAVVIRLSTFLKGSEQWKKARAIHFASSQKGIEQLLQYFLGFSSDPQEFLILLEPTGGYYGASLPGSTLPS